MQQTRPLSTVRTAPVAPSPKWEGLFVEPVYADGQPYDQDTPRSEGDADDAPAAVAT
jgi:hypothetical protein